ncbi:hypothetical protein DFJ73DRAFT_228827 [Zopfochytrium polystomum]|nr:hypothetical protein DFJ73DRAFT_228827 [Zopfochytrium polystomum]
MPARTKNSNKNEWIPERKPDDGFTRRRRGYAARRRRRGGLEGQGAVLTAKKGWSFKKATLIIGKAFLAARQHSEPLRKTYKTKQITSTLPTRPVVGLIGAALSVMGQIHFKLEFHDPAMRTLNTTTECFNGHRCILRTHEVLGQIHQCTALYRERRTGWTAFRPWWPLSASGRSQNHLSFFM